MKQYLLTALLIGATYPGLRAQESVGGTPMSVIMGVNGSHIPTVNASSFDPASIPVETGTRAVRVPHDAQLLAMNVGLANAGAWAILPNGDRIWRVRLVSAGALATELFFSGFHLPEGASMYIYDDRGEQLLGGFTAANNNKFGVFATARIMGEASVVEYYEPLSVAGEGTFTITGLGHTYRSLDDDRAQDCEVDVNCTPEGDGWADQRDAVVRVRVVDNLGQIGYCSGSLTNNVRLDCKPYFLTANHCGTEAEVDSAHFQLWKFYFKFQRSGCGSGSAPQNKIMTGCVKRASSNDNGGDSGSDFLLLEADNPVPDNFTPFWNGWNVNNTAVSGAKGIHHPNGDEKKISTVNGNTQNATWGNVPGTHWRVTWAGTTNGHGVTEGGSSGSPLFNSTGHTIGTLTGGGSYCNSVVPGGESQPDYYGKLSYDWQSNGGGVAAHLKTWLDPDNTGMMVLEGSYGPCGSLGIANVDMTTGPLISPNPSNGMVHITYPKGVEHVDLIEVLDMMGREVFRSVPLTTSGADLDVTGWSDGNYFVRITAAGVRCPVAKLAVYK